MGTRWMPSGKKNDDDDRLQPRVARTRTPANVSFELSIADSMMTRSGCQKHGIDGSQVIIFSVEDEEDGEADEITPAEKADRV